MRNCKFCGGRKGDVTRDDLRGRFLAQHIIPTLLRHCFEREHSLLFRMIARLCQHYNAVLRRILSLRIVPCNISLSGDDEISFSLSKLECPPQEVKTREIRLHLQIANWNKRDRVWKHGNSFLNWHFRGVAFVDANAPYYVLSGWFLLSLRLFEILAKIAKLTTTKVDPFQSVGLGCQPRRVRVYLFFF